jgi:hypothetical protein
MKAERIYDLEERLLDYAAEMIRLVEQVPDRRTGNHGKSPIFGSFGNDPSTPPGYFGSMRVSRLQSAAQPPIWSANSHRAR